MKEVYLICKILFTRSYFPYLNFQYLNSLTYLTYLILSDLSYLSYPAYHSILLSYLIF